jgi:hypothetical protein
MYKNKRDPIEYESCLKIDMLGSALLHDRI